MHEVERPELISEGGQERFTCDYWIYKSRSTFEDIDVGEDWIRNFNKFAAINSTRSSQVPADDYIEAGK